MNATTIASLITSSAVVLLVGSGKSEPSSSPESLLAETVTEVPTQLRLLHKNQRRWVDVQPELPSGNVPDISMREAAMIENIEAVKQHLDVNVDVNEKDEYGRTPFHAAWHGGHHRISDLLNSKGADVNARGDNGMTSMHYVAWEVHTEIVELLIAKSADANPQLDGGLTPLDWAEQKKHPQTADFIRKHDGKTGEELK